MFKPNRINIKYLSIAVLYIALAGCFLQTISGATFLAGNDLITTVSTDSILATCVQGSVSGGNLECTYFFRDKNGVPVEVISSADLISEFGILGVLVDPLILQVPLFMNVNSATYDTGAGPLPLEVSTVRSFPVDPETFAIAEPGTQFIILEYPESLTPMIPGGDALTGLPVSHQLEFQQTRAPDALDNPFLIKGIFTAPYEVRGTTYYLPMLPCTADFSQAPSIEIDPTTGSQDYLDFASASLLASQPCNGQQYVFFTIGTEAQPSDGDLNFGSVFLGEAQRQTMSVMSTGLFDLEIVSVQTPTAAEFTVVRDECTGVMVAPLANCELEVEFQPGAAITVNDSLAVTTRDSSNPTLTVALSGEGVLQEPEAGTNCNSVDFGGVSPGSQATFRRTIWNPGQSNLTLSEVNLLGSASFSVQLDDCSNVTLQPSFGCNVDLSYQPQASGSDNATLEVASNDSAADLNLLLTGTAIEGLILDSAFESRCEIGG